MDISITPEVVSSFLLTGFVQSSVGLQMLTDVFIPSCSWQVDL